MSKPETKLDEILRKNATAWVDYTRGLVTVNEAGSLCVGKNRFLNPNDKAVILGMPKTDYHAETDHISSSSLKVFIERPSKYARLFVGRRNEDAYTSSPSKMLGSLVHSMLFEPDTLDQLYEVEYSEGDGGDPINRKRKADRELLEMQRLNAVAQGKALVTEKQLALAVELSEAANLCSVAYQSLQCPESMRELTIMVPDPASGVRIKAQLDLLTIEPALNVGRACVISDVKTSVQPNPDEFVAKDVPTFDYDISAAVYRRAFKLLTGITPLFRWIVLSKDEKGGDHQCFVVELESSDMRVADEVAEHYLSMLGRSQMSDRFVNPYSGQVNRCHLPGYRFKEFKDRRQ